MGRAMINDLDFTLRWVGLYFTLFLALWNGRTPGKYLLGIRVVRLNGEPLGLWFAFERLGGYAAGIATGMLGFEQRRMSTWTRRAGAPTARRDIETRHGT
jgi:uncharacterized RDD family membrane protein YckC